MKWNTLKPSYKLRSGSQKFGGSSVMRGNNLLFGIVMLVPHRCVVGLAP